MAPAKKVNLSKEAQACLLWSDVLGCASECNRKPHLGHRVHGPTFPSPLWMAFCPRPSNVVFISMRCDYETREECLLSVIYLSLRCTDGGRLSARVSVHTKRVQLPDLLGQGPQPETTINKPR